MGFFPDDREKAAAYDQAVRDNAALERRIEELAAELANERDTLRKLVEDMRTYVLRHGILIGECVAWDQLKKRTGVGQA